MLYVHRFLLAASLVVLLALFGCKEGTLEPELTGSIAGQVLDFETGAPIPSVNVTTSPPTEAIVTDADGRFAVTDIDAGNYTISVRRSSYAPNSVTVNVRENRTTEAVLFMEEEGADEPAPRAMEVDILNWTTRASVTGDSQFVRVEYRAQNTGGRDIDRYEAYFRIATASHVFVQEEVGDSLGVGQSDVSVFERYTLDEVAQAVEVESLSF